MLKQLLVFHLLSVAGQDQVVSVRSRQVHINHLYGLELVQDDARSQAGGFALGHLPECHL